MPYTFDSSFNEIDKKYWNAYAVCSREEETKKEDVLETIICSEDREISLQMDFSILQESWSFRNVALARRLAKQLISENGSLDLMRVRKAIKFLERNLYAVGPKCHFDDLHRAEVKEMLEKIASSKTLQTKLAQITKPISNAIAEKLIRETLLLKPNEVLQDTHAKQATLAAMLTKLRQNVGSCFATAPAILLLKEQPLQFLEDIKQLLGIGRLTRVFKGMEYSVPLSYSSGIGDLKKPIAIYLFGKDPIETLSNSYGLQTAFLAAGILTEQDDGLKKNCRSLLEKSSLFPTELNPFSTTNAEAIIKGVLLKFFGLDESDLKEFSLASELKTPFMTFNEGRRGSFQRFRKAFELAKGAFRAVTDNALLKAWEFTLASLSETKADYARYNLQIALGFHESKAGISGVLYETLRRKIEQLNQVIEEYQSKYDHVYAQLKSLEGRATRAAGERELGWLQSEYQTRRFELQRIASERDEFYDKGQKLNQLPQFLFSFYSQKIPEYFQEIYDPEMQDVTDSSFDDSPAGFRLVYKFGRSNPSLWSSIHSSADFLQSLISFFTSTEIELLRLPQVSGIENEVNDFLASLFNELQKKEFLEEAFHRLATAYKEPIFKDPVENQEYIARKPWSYVSGGTMSTLLGCYFGTEAPIEEQARWVESETELFAFYLDTIRELPASTQKKFQEKKKEYLLAFSPTHAFLIQPGRHPFRLGWESDTYSYSFIRDKWTGNQKETLSEIHLDFPMMDEMIERISFSFPFSYRSLFKNLFRNFSYTMSTDDFRNYLIKTLSYEKWISAAHQQEAISAEIDKHLYLHLPLFPSHLLVEKVHHILSKAQLDSKLDEFIRTNIEKHPMLLSRRIFGADDLRKIFLTYFLKFFKKTKLSDPLFYTINLAMAEARTRLPLPILFADTNWVNQYFGFVVNPGNLKLELWRFDESGTFGVPMTSWKKYLNGSAKEQWGIYTNPIQYEK